MEMWHLCLCGRCSLLVLCIHVVVSLPVMWKRLSPCLLCFYDCTTFIIQLLISFPPSFPVYGSPTRFSLVKMRMTADKPATFSCSLMVHWFPFTDFVSRLRHRNTLLNIPPLCLRHQRIHLFLSALKGPERPQHHGCVF